MLVLTIPGWRMAAIAAVAGNLEKGLANMNSAAGTSDIHK